MRMLRFAETLDGESENQDGSQEAETALDKTTHLADSIRGNRNTLSLSMISVDYGLLDALLSMGILTHEQCEVIRSKPTETSRAAQLLDDVISTSHEQQEQFLAALDQTRQTHVSNFIRADGQRTADHGDDWPFIAMEGKMMMELNWGKLVENIDTKNGLLDEMLSSNCITSRYYDRIVNKPDDLKNGDLLNFLRRKSIADFKTFVECLAKTKQHRAVSLLTPDGEESTKPLSTERESRILTSYSTLICLLDTKNGLMTELLAADCLTWRQKEFIESAASQSESNMRLLSIVRRGTEPDFDKFIACLIKNGQQHVTRVLLEDKIVAHIVAKNSGAGNVKEHEATIVEQFMSLLVACPTEQRRQLYAKLDQIKSQLGDDVELLAASTEHSIGMFYACQSLAGILHLYELYSSGQLKTITDELFDVLLANNDKLIKVNELIWRPSDYNRCIQHVCSSSGLAVFSEIYQLAVLRNDDRLLSTLGFDVGHFPFELIEMLLIKASGMLFCDINVTSSRAAACAVATLSAVSKFWWRAMTYRQYNRHLLMKYYDRVRHPYTRCCPQQMTLSQLIVKDNDCNVFSLAVFRSKLYVASGRSDTVQVFTCNPPFGRLQEDIRVEGMCDPRDMVVCNKTSQLYIADRIQRAIWRVNLLSVKESVKFVTVEWLPWTLSVNSGRLLVTPYDGDALFVYDNEGQLLNGIQLPRYFKARHAVESSRKTYIVSHHSRSTAPPECRHGVSEVDVNGQVVRHFNSQPNARLQVNEPHYVLVDDNGHVIIDDARNERIVLLKPDLRLKQLIVTSLPGLPWRKCYDKDTGLLFVSYLQYAEISAFKISNYRL